MYCEECLHRLISVMNATSGGQNGVAIVTGHTGIIPIANMSDLELLLPITILRA